MLSFYVMGKGEFREPVLSGDRFFTYKDQIRTLLLQVGSIFYSFSISEIQLDVTGVLLKVL